MTIINPWIFYLIDTLSKISLLSMIIAIFLIFALFLLALFRSDEHNDEIKKTFNKWISISSTVLIICFILSALIPSKETMYTMLVANYVTYDNVEIATDTIKDSVDYIFDKFNESED